MRCHNIGNLEEEAQFYLEFNLGRGLVQSFFGFEAELHGLLAGVLFCGPFSTWIVDCLGWLIV